MKSNFLIKMIFSMSVLMNLIANAAFDGNYTFQLESATKATIDTINAPQTGMMIYNTTDNEINYYNGTTWIVLSAKGIYGVDKQLSGDREVDLDTNNLGFISGNVGIGDATPDATLDVAGSLRLDGAYYDKDGDTGIVSQVLTSTATGTDWTSSVAAPNISSSTIVVSASTTTTITIVGGNFIPSSVVTIVGFNGTINNTNIVSPTQIELNITTGTTANFDIIVSNAGVLNTQWAGNGVGLLNVQGNDGQTQSLAGLTCKGILDDGLSIGDGVYWINPDGGDTSNAFQVYCDMTADGGGWTLVFRHDVSGGYFANNNEADSFNETSPGLTTTKYSILNKIDSIKSATAYEFRLYYPNEDKRNHWKQTFDPRSGVSPVTPVSGYVPIAIDSSVNLWGGLDRDTGNNTFLDGSVSHGNWWYSIGSRASFGGGIPGHSSQVVAIVEVYIR